MNEWKNVARPEDLTRERPHTIIQNVRIGLEVPGSIPVEVQTEDWMFLSLPDKPFTLVVPIYWSYISVPRSDSKLYFVLFRLQ